MTAYENPSDSPTGAPFVLAPYGEPTARPARVASSEFPYTSIRAAQEVVEGDRGRLILYTTMATWCVPCLDELPALNLLRSTFTTDELEIFGVPYDGEETLDLFESWSDLYDPPYRILSELNTEQREAVIDGALDALRLEGVPAAVITDAEGEVQLVRWGPPSVSEIRVLLANMGGYR